MIRYVVQPGDTLTSIALRHGTTVRALMDANNLANPDIIFVGQVLLIPTTGPTPPTPPTCPPCPPCPPTPPTPPTPPFPPFLPTPPPPTTRPSVTRTFDGVEYTLSVNKSVYAVGEPIIIRLSKRNILTVPLTLTYRTSQKVDFRVTQDSVLIWQWSRGRFFTEGITSDRLQPREEKVYRVEWNQRTDSAFLRPGIYTLTGWNLATPGVRLTLQFRVG